MIRLCWVERYRIAKLSAALLQETRLPVFRWSNLNTELETSDQLQYNFVPNSSGICRFKVRASNDAHISLSANELQTGPMYEVIIGGWANTKSVIRKNGGKPDVAEVPTPNILNAEEFRGFWIRWEGNTIWAGHANEQRPFISWTDTEHTPISYVGFCTGWGASGSWIIEQPHVKSVEDVTDHLWVEASNGLVPPGAFIAGEDNGELEYVIRAKFKGGLIPGKLVPSHGVAYVPWNGEANPVVRYEVLCNFDGEWVLDFGGNIPANAIVGGRSEDGDTLHVGRVAYEGTLTVGKVQKTHRVCYIPYDGQELNFSRYEVLVSRHWN